MQRFYIDLTILAPHDNTPHAMTQLMSNLHRLLREHGKSDVGACFPEYGKHDSKANSSLGAVLRLVSLNSESLKKLTGNVTFQTLKGVSVLEISSVNKVPEERVKQEVVFYKDNRPIRAMKFHKQDVQADSTIARLSYHDLKGASVLLLIEKRGKSAYPIFVSRQVLKNHQAGDFNSFGFAAQDGPSVPIF